MIFIFAVEPNSDRDVFESSEFITNVMRELHGVIKGIDERTGYTAHISQPTEHAGGHYYLRVESCDAGGDSDDVLLFILSESPGEVIKFISQEEPDENDSDLKDRAIYVSRKVLEYKSMFDDTWPAKMGWTKVPYKECEYGFVLFTFSGMGEKYLEIQRDNDKTVTVDHDHPIVEDYGLSNPILTKIKRKLGKLF